MQHIYNGKCPDAEQPDSSDPDCPACSSQFCRWSPWDETTYGVGTYDTGCGNAHCLTEGDITENGYKFCPYCGKPIESV